MNITINPEYSNLTTEIKHVFRGEYTPVKTFCNKRNTVEMINIDGKHYVLKRFKPISIIKGFVYTFLRKTKARRAYENAVYLLENGIDTATPVAYAEQKHFGIFRYGFFLSEMIKKRLASEILYDSTGSVPPHEKEIFGKEIALFVADMHKRGIIPLDFNPDNVFFSIDKNGKYQFSLIDINRMKIGCVPDLKSAMRSFFQLGLNTWTLHTIIPHYADLRNFSADECTYYTMKWRYDWERNHRIKHKLRKLLHLNRQ